MRIGLWSPEASDVEAVLLNGVPAGPSQTVIACDEEEGWVDRAIVEADPESETGWRTVLTSEGREWLSARDFVIGKPPTRPAIEKHVPSKPMAEIEATIRRRRPDEVQYEVWLRKAHAYQILYPPPAEMRRIERVTGRVQIVWKKGTKRRVPA